MTTRVGVLGTFAMSRGFSPSGPVRPTFVTLAPSRISAISTPAAGAPSRITEIPIASLPAWLRAAAKTRPAADTTIPSRISSSFASSSGVMTRPGEMFRSVSTDAEGVVGEGLAGGLDGHLVVVGGQLFGRQLQGQRTGSGPGRREVLSAEHPAAL